ncbi:hypothetical protein AB0J83_41825 [Actinoplanes sp. NPDC049596]|uniref:hypothetical protein n=1 Tax=unclassified Actinoplanes TaxID=2626549 RepID=UPI0034391286
MTARRTLPFAAALALLAGCGGTSPPAAAPSATAVVSVSASPSVKPVTPREELKAAVGRLLKTPYGFSLIGDYPQRQKVRAFGAQDAAAGKLTRTVVVTGGPDRKFRKLIVIGTDSYRGEDNSGYWVHADLSRLKPGNEYYGADPKDPSGLIRFEQAVTVTRRTGPRTFQGEAWIMPGITLLPLGAPNLSFREGVSVDYTATTDAQNRLTSISIDIAKGAMKQTMTITYDKPVTIAKPAKADELRKSLYDKP